MLGLGCVEVPASAESNGSAFFCPKTQKGRETPERTRKKMQHKTSVCVCVCVYCARSNTEVYFVK